MKNNTIGERTFRFGLEAKQMFIEGKPKLVGADGDNAKPTPKYSTTITSRIVYEDIDGELFMSFLEDGGLIDNTDENSYLSAYADAMAVADKNASKYEPRLPKPARKKFSELTNLEKEAIRCSVEVIGLIVLSVFTVGRLISKSRKKRKHHS